MTRDEMLVKLHNIRIAAQPTVITYDMGLQYEYVTPEGHGEGFGNMGDWPVYKLKGITPKILEYVKLKLREGTLSIDDLGDTDLARFYDNTIGCGRPASCIPSICDFFRTIVSVKLGQDGILFALCDAGQWTPEAYFYSTYEELEEAFAAFYVTYIEEWCDMEDDDLKLWVERIEDELDSLPFVALRGE